MVLILSGAGAAGVVEGRTLISISVDQTSGRGGDRVAELGVVELGEDAAAAQQLGEAAALDDLPVAQHQDQIGARARSRGGAR